MEWHLLTNHANLRSGTQLVAFATEWLSCLLHILEESLHTIRVHDVFFHHLFKACRRAAQNEEAVYLRSTLRSVVATECHKLGGILGGLSIQFTIIQPLLHRMWDKILWPTNMKRWHKVSKNCLFAVPPTGGDWWDSFFLSSQGCPNSLQVSC